jgi:2-oxoglutarate dehydrogenase complex dehydrogenase (E1) component-like enzyme
MLKVHPSMFVEAYLDLATEKTIKFSNFLGKKFYTLRLKPSNHPNPLEIQFTKINP